jgi:uncharacterized membrane protein
MRHDSFGHKLEACAFTSSLAPVRRLGRRAIFLLGTYLAVILALVVAGFFGATVGIWASVLWGD